MGKGNWTSSGHYVVVYDIQGNTIYINDSASKKSSRTQGSYSLFKQQVKYYWVIEPPAKTATTTTTTTTTTAATPEKEDDDMDVTRFKELWREMRKELQDNDANSYSEEARTWAVDAGIIQGGSSGDFNGMWEDVLTREQMVVCLYRFAQMMGKA